jgi:hypothetical protein
MNPERWRRVEELLDGALELPPAERESFLRRECADAPELAGEVSKILRAGERPGSILDAPVHRLAPLLPNEEIPAPPERVGPYRI